MTSSRRRPFVLVSLLAVAFVGWPAYRAPMAHIALSNPPQDLMRLPRLLAAGAPGYEYVVAESVSTSGPDNTAAIQRRARVRGPFVDMETCETERRLDILGGRVQPLTECDTAGIFKELRKRRE
jgi:hypothetical protein